MHPLKYYIWWTDARKQWYDYWYVSRARFMVESTKEWRKQTEFVNDYVNEIIKNDKDRTDWQIEKLQGQIDKAKVEIEKIEEKRDLELSEIKEKYIKDRKDAELKKDEIELNFKKISSNILSNMTQANTVINWLVEKLKQYANDSEKYWNSQTEKIWEEWKNFSISSKKFTWEEIKKILLYWIDKDTLVKDKKSCRKDIISMIFFILLCGYDFLLWYKAVWYFIVQNTTFWIITRVFVSLMFVPLVIWSVHYAASTLWWSALKQSKLWKYTIYFILLIVLLYVAQSLPESVKSALDPRFVSFLETDALELIFRLFMIPSMFIWEIIIESTDWENIANHFSRIWKKFSVVTHLVRNWLTALKMRSLSKWLKEEKKIISENIDNIKSESTPDFSKIKEEITEIQSLINPIYDNQAWSKWVYERSLNEVKDEIQDLKNKYDEKVVKVNFKYSEETKEMKNLVDTNKRLIDSYTKQLSELESDTREWFLRWLRG